MNILRSLRCRVELSLKQVNGTGKSFDIENENVPRKIPVVTNQTVLEGALVARARVYDTAAAYIAPLHVLVDGEIPLALIMGSASRVKHANCSSPMASATTSPDVTALDNSSSSSFLLS